MKMNPKKRHKLLQVSFSDLPVATCQKKLIEKEPEETLNVKTRKPEERIKQTTTKCSESRKKSSSKQELEKEQSRDKRKSNQVIAFRLLLASISVAIHINCLGGGFVYDDRRAILQNRNVMEHGDTWAGLKGIFLDDFWGTPLENAGSHKSYRPLVSLSFRLQASPSVHRTNEFLFSQASSSGILPPSEAPGEDDKQLSVIDGLQSLAFAFHLVNLLLHLLVVDSVFRLATILTAMASSFRSVSSLKSASKLCKIKSPMTQLNAVACLTSLLFTCHPVHVESVASLVGRAELMGALFALSSFSHLAAYLSAAQPEAAGRQLVKSCLWAALACLSKENCASVILINLALIGWWSVVVECDGVSEEPAQRKSADKTGSNWKLMKRRRSIGAMLLLLIAYSALRVHLSGGLKLTAKPLPRFSHLDNPLAQSGRQFCLRSAMTTESSSSRIQQPNGNDSGEEGDCSNLSTIRRLELGMLATRLYLPIAALKLLLWPRDLSYDWPLESLGGLIKSPLDSRSLQSLAIYLLLAAYLIRSSSRYLLFALDSGYSRYLRLERDSLPVQLSALKQQTGSSSDGQNSGERDGHSSDESETSSVKSVDTVKSCDSGFAELPVVATEQADNNDNGNFADENKENDRLMNSAKSLSHQVEKKDKEQRRKKRFLRRRARQIQADQVAKEPEKDEAKGSSAAGESASGEDPIGWSLLWLLVPYLPASNLLFPVGFLLAERTLYLPSFGFCLLIACLLRRLPVSKFPGTKRGSKLAAQLKGPETGVSFLLIAPLLILGSLRTHWRSADWRSEVDLFRSNLRQSPAKSLSNLATLTAEVETGATSGSLELRERLYRAALAGEPHSAELHYNLALALHLGAKQGPSAGGSGFAPNKQIERHYRLALELRPNFPLAALNLGAYQAEVASAEGSDYQLTKAEQSFVNCARNMSPREGSRSFRHHVRVQIECLISAGKLQMSRTIPSDHVKQTHADSNGKQTTSGAKQTNGCSDEGTKVLEWMALAIELSKQIDGHRLLSMANSNEESTIDGHRNYPLDSEQFHSIGDLSKQLATIHWILAKCDTKSTGQNFASSLEFALRSQVLIEPQIYLDYANFLLQKSQPNEAIKMLKSAVETEDRKSPMNSPAASEQLAKLHAKLAKILAASGRKEEAAERMETAVSLAPEEAEMATFGAQLAHDLGLNQRSEQLYARSLKLLELSLTKSHPFVCSNNNKKVDGKQLEAGKRLASALVNYGAIMEVNGRPLDAVRELYRRALDCDQRNSNARKNLQRIQ